MISSCHLIYVYVLVVTTSITMQWKMRYCYTISQFYVLSSHYWIYGMGLRALKVERCLYNISFPSMVHVIYWRDRIGCDLTIIMISTGQRVEDKCNKAVICFLVEHCLWARVPVIALKDDETKISGLLVFFSSSSSSSFLRVGGAGPVSMCPWPPY